MPEHFVGFSLSTFFICVNWFSVRYFKSKRFLFVQFWCKMRFQIELDRIVIAIEILVIGKIIFLNCFKKRF